MTEPMARIEAALRRLGAEHEPPIGWEARVIAATVERKRVRWWMFAIPVAVLAVLAIVIFVPRDPSKVTRLKLALTSVRDATVVVRIPSPTPSPSRSQPSMIVGEVLRAVATGEAPHRALWIYRDRTLVMACPRDPRCQSSDDELVAKLELELVGSYEIVALASSSIIAAPAGSYDEDVARAEDAGAVVTIERENVR